ncbi:MAG TPA: M14 metallopeptidase family protein, partial [bacterium]
MKLADRRITWFGWALLLIVCHSAHSVAQIKTPADFVGHKIGEDRKLFGWDKVTEYFRMLDEHSDKVLVEELGQTTLSKPFLMATISSSHNLLNLAKYKNLQKQAANPRHLSEADARLLARENKAVVMITLNIHSTEIASSQESIELAYLLATDNSPRTQRILENVIILLIPSMNPDGMQRVVDWYLQYLDTPHEGSPMPYLYHPYAGHDNNRDWFMMNLTETRIVSRQYYHEWFPHIIYDQHQMRSESARLFLPPYADPLNPNVHPLLYAQMNKFGKHIASELQAQKFRGIVTDAFYTAWWQGASVMTPWWHNMMGILSEVASAQIATPLYFPRGSLAGGRQGLPGYNRRMNFLDPWPGGWWHLRNIIDYELAITFSLLDLAAQEKESIIYNFCQMNLNAIARGKSEPPFAYIVPTSQHDPMTALKMLDILLFGGAEIHRAQADFFAGHLRFSRGDYVILLSQPFRPYVKDLMERQRYPVLRATPDGPPIRPYDVTGWTLPLMMGVNIVEIAEPFTADLTQVENIARPDLEPLNEDKDNYIISHSSNAVFRAVNLLLTEGSKVYWLKKAVEVDGKPFAPGALFVPQKEMKPEKMNVLSRALALEVHQTEKSLAGQVAYQIRNFKLGLYQPWTANMDEGWSRLILEQFEFPYKSIYNSTIRNSSLRADFDVIIIPDMEPKQILNGHKKEKPDMYSPLVPDMYLDGIGEEGVKKLRDFVEKGGILITLDSACDFAIEQFGLPAVNVVKDIKDSDFSCPGSLLAISVDNTEPIGFGMPAQAAAMFVNSPAFRPLYWPKRTAVPASYADDNLLLSGWIEGEDKIAGMAAVLDIP